MAKPAPLLIEIASDVVCPWCYIGKRRLGKAIAALNQTFADIVRTGEIVQGSALPQEKNEAEIWELPRLILTPHRRSFGRFRQLIDAINLAGIDQHSDPKFVPLREVEEASTRS
jgi:hypothetical protein